MTRRLARGDRLVIATHNAGKLREIADLLAPLGIDAVSAGSLGLPEPEETEPDFAGNAKLKAVAASGLSGLPALADDSGLCVAALDGAPGIYSARWAGPERDFGAAMARVEHELHGCGNRSAWFICMLCLAWPNGETALFEGRSDGAVVWPPRGTHGFGYDPMFQPEGEDRTYGEMQPAEKHATNHRARAFAKFLISCSDNETI